jgi:CRP-like cAMP-binding protein
MSSAEGSADVLATGVVGLPEGVDVDSRDRRSGSHDGDLPPSPRSDQRLGPRVAAYIPVQLELSSAGEKRLLARSRDLGTGGLCVATADPFPLEEVVRVAIEFPGASLAIEARACWQQRVTDEDAVLTGIRFVTAESSVRRRIAETVQRRACELASFMDESESLPGLDFDACLELSLFSRLRQIPAGRIIYRAGQSGVESLFVVFRGAVRLESDSASEDGSVLVQGRSFGGLSLVSNVPSRTTAHAVEPVQLLEVDAFAYRFIELGRPVLARLVQRSIVERVMTHFGRPRSETRMPDGPSESSAGPASEAG